MREHWQELGQKLKGKLNVYIGTQDTFRLDGAMRLFAADLQQLGGHRSFEAAMRYQHATTAGQRAIADFRTEQMRQARQVVDLEQVRRSREGGPEALAQ